MRKPLGRERKQYVDDCENGRLTHQMVYDLVDERDSYANRCDRFSAGLERIMEICREERLPSSQIFEIAEEALIEPDH